MRKSAFLATPFFEVNLQGKIQTTDLPAGGPISQNFLEFPITTSSRLKALLLRVRYTNIPVYRPK